MNGLLISASALLDRHLRLRQQPQTRVDEIVELRRRLRAAPLEVPAAEAELAQRMRELRLRLSALVGEVQACRTCAIGHPPPHGHFQGGHCCGLRTEDAFNDDELAALKLAGTTPADLRPPMPSDHAGCSFRGPTGCSLQVPDRPNLCLRYLCPDLTRELARRDPQNLAEIDAVNAELEALYLTFIQRRAARAPDDLDAIDAMLERP